MISAMQNEPGITAGANMDTFQVSSVGYDGILYVFPAWEDGSIPIMAASGSGSATRVILDREGAKKLAMLLNERADSISEI
jgi:hypothetical protein